MLIDDQGFKIKLIDTMDSSNAHSSFLFQEMKIHTHPEVYEPAEDTFLMVENINVRPHKDVLEIGAGTGIISLFCAKMGAQVICTDINPYAISLIKKNIKENRSQFKETIDVRQGDLFNIIKDDEQFDLIIFNPPYIPTTPEQKKGISSWYVCSFDGGASGLKMTKRFISQVKPYLKEQGTALFITSSFSNKEFLNKIIKKSTLSHQVIKKFRCDDEILSVHELSTSSLPESI